MAGGLFCSSGGCTAKLGPDILERVLSRIERGAADPNLLVGFDTGFLPADAGGPVRVWPDCGNERAE